MAAPNPYVGTDEDFDPALHWGAFPAPAARTYTGQTVAGHDPSDYFFGSSGGEVSLQGVIDAKRIRGCARWFLGYNNMEPSNPFSLQRENPACHPRFTNFVCTAVSFHEFKPIRKNAPVNSTNSGLKLPRNDETSGWVATVVGGGTPKTFTYYTGYEKANVTARFTPARFKYLVDSDTLKEYGRNTIIDTEPRTEVLTLSGAKIIFIEGTGNTGTTSNPKGVVSPSDVSTILIKPDLKVTWFDVPEKFISQNSILLPGQVYPDKIVRALGTLNRYDWISYKKGTLLFVGAHLMRRPWVLAAGGSNSVDSYPANVRESMFNYDIELLFSYFNPVKGYTGDSQIVDATVIAAGVGPGGADVTGADIHGHNCQPWRGADATLGTVLGNTDKNAGRFFYATFDGLANGLSSDTGSQGIYRYSAYDNIFSSVWAADIT